MRHLPFLLCLSLLATAPLSHVAAQDKPAATKGSWSSRQVGDVQIETPFELKEVPGIAANLPDEVRQKVDSMRSSMGGGEDSFIVFVTTSTYKAGVPVSLDGTVSGMINGAATRMGDTNPKSTTTPTKVSGLEARRATYENKLPNGQPLHIEILAVQRGQTVVQVQGLYSSDTFKADVERMMASIAIKPAP